MTKTKPVTEAQQWVLRQMLEGRTKHTGRNGYSKPAMLALERRGWVKPGRKYLREQYWSFTEAGHQAAKDEVARYKAFVLSRAS